MSHNERIVAKYLLNYKGNIHTLTANDIAKDTFVSASTVIRLSKKLGCNGWLDLREKIEKEKTYLELSYDDVDSNYPFTQQDSIQKIASMISTLLSETILETERLFQHDNLIKAIQYLSLANSIYIFAMSHSSSMTYDFKYKMKTLYKRAHIINNRDDFIYILNTLTKNDCCIFISYSGESFNNLYITKYLKTRHYPCISITKYSDNTLVQVTDVHLYIPNKEERFDKIANYVSNQSIHYILDVLYSGIFNKDYQTNIIKTNSYYENNRNLYKNK